MTQTQQILQLLKDRGHRGLTALEALEEAGCFRLAARIEELRRAGEPIRSETVHNFATNKRYTRYYLIEPVHADQLTVGL